MFNCQFCGYDYSEQGLPEGRCPSCGVLLAWQDESSSPANSISDSELPSAPVPSFSPPQPPAPDPDDYESPAAPPQQPAPPHQAAPANQGSAPPVDEQNAEPAGTNSPGPDADASESPASDKPTPPEDRVGGATVRSQILPDFPLRKSADVSDENYSRMVENIWSRSITNRPDSTIQTPSNYGTVSNLVIRQRALAQGSMGDAAAADYELLDVIGEGGVGIVYSARQASINRTVAVKMLRSREDEASEKGKFLAEAVVTGELDHPNIVPIYDLGSNEEGSLFYSMKQVHGTPWSEAIFSKPLTENIEILMKVGDAVAFSHARGVVHRDLKPENVMLGEFGEVLVMDWGMALSMAIESQMPEGESTAGMGGTPAYMAPEMATGPMSKIGPASDVYLLGAILYECITSKPPHRGKTVLDCIANAGLNDIAPTEHTGELVDIAMRAMATEPQDRYENVKEFQAAIREYESHLESIALVQRGTQALAQAETTRDYKEFSRSIVAFEEATSLWSKNKDATLGLDEAIKAYASAALANGDYELGLSLLNERSPAHKPLVAKLKRGLKDRDARQQRINSLRRTAIALVLVMLAGATGASGVLFTFWSNAVKAREEADFATQLADQEAANAVKEKQVAEVERKAAKTARDQAEAALTQAEVSSANESESLYRFEIQLAHERINDNAFQTAEQLLDEQIESAQKKFRHWEWGRLRYLCELSEATLTKADQVDAAAVLSVAASPNNDSVAIGFADGKVLLWRTADRTWNEVENSVPTVLPSAGGPVSALAISKNGAYLAVGVDANENNLTIFNIADADAEPQLSYQLNGHTSSVNSLRFSADSHKLLSCSDDMTARLWIPSSEDDEMVFYGHFDAVQTAGFSHDEQLVVTSSKDGSARVWNPKTGAEVANFDKHDGAIYGALFLPGDLQVATCGEDGRILLWTPRIDQTILTAKTESEAKRLYASSQVRRVEDILDDDAKPEEAPEFLTIAAHQGPIRTLALAAEGALLVSGGDDSTLRVWDPVRLLGAATGEPSETAARIRQALIARALPEDLDRGLLVTMRGHGSWISSCATTGNGRQILTGSFDQTAKVWDLLNYQEVERFEFKRRAIVSADQSRYGESLAAALDDGTARVWRGDGDVMQIPPLTEGHSYLTSKAVLDSKRNRLYTAAGDNSVSLWDFRSGGQIWKQEGTGREGVLALSQDGRYLVTGSSSKAAEVWLGKNPHVTLDHARFIRERLRKALPSITPKELDQRTKPITAAAVAKDNDRVFAGDSDGGGWLWSIQDVKDNPQAAPGELRLHSSRINAAAFIDNDRLLATASSDTTVAIWNVEKSEETAQRIRHPGPVTVMTISADEREIATATVQRVQLAEEEWQTSSFAHLSRIGDTRPKRSVPLKLADGVDIERVNSISLASDQKSALIACSVGSKDYLFRWTFSAVPGQAERLEPLWRNNIFRGSISAALLTPENDVLTVGGRGGVLWAEDGDIKRSFQPHSRINSIRFSPSEKYVVTAGTDGVTKIWLIADGSPRVVAKLELQADARKAGLPMGIMHAEFHPTRDDIVLTAGADHTARIWKIDFAASTATVTDVLAGEQGHSDKVRQASYSHDGRSIVTVSDDQRALIWDSDDLSQPIQVLEHNAAVLCGRFSDDDQWIATGSADHTASIWRRADAKRLARVQGHSSVVTAVDFSSDNQRFLTGSRDNSTLLWDITDLRRDSAEGESPSTPRRITREVLALEHHQSGVTSAAFSLDGRSIITSSLDGSLALCRTQRVEPSILLSVGKPVDCAGSWYETNAGELVCQSEDVQVDAGAFIRQPSVESYLDYRLVAAVDEGQVDVEKKTAEEDAVVDMTEILSLNPDWSDAIRVDADGAILYGLGDDAAPIGFVEKQTKNSARIEVRFTEKATAPGIEAVLHCIAYRNQSFELEQTRPIQILLIDAAGKSGNFAGGTRRKVRLSVPERPVEKTPVANDSEAPPATEAPSS